MTLTLTDPAALAQALIACPSITPATGTVFDCLEAMLLPLGFTVERFLDGEPSGEPVENLLAVRRSGDGPHFAFAGHLDVVPPGEGWTGDAFAPAPVQAPALMPMEPPTIPPPTPPAMFPVALISFSGTFRLRSIKSARMR